VPPFLQSLAGRRQFIVYRLVPTDSGAVDKIPVDPDTLDNLDAQSPENWLLPETAWAISERLGAGFGVGLVIVEGSGLGCIDIDHCLDRSTGMWSEHSAKMCARFHGSAVEISQSGESLHILFSYSGTVAPHRVKNAATRTECYTRKRFIALTFRDMVGDVLLDQTAALLWTLAEMFPPAPEHEVDPEWTETPVAAWFGPTDDDELIDVMLRSRGSPHALFGKGVTLQQLWNSDDAALAQAFPPNKPLDAFDRSSADQALFNHLAFYTGSDCERMLRLARRSALARDKWERPDYISRTVIRSASECRNWYSRGSRTSPPAPTLTAAIEIGHVAESDAPQASAPVEGEFSPGDYLTVPEQHRLFAGCVWVRDVDQILIPDGSRLDRPQFDSTFGGFEFSVSATEQKPITSAWECFTKSRLTAFPKVHSDIFMPTRGANEIFELEGRRYVNTFVPVPIERKAGDVTPFLDHLRRLIPNDRDREIALSFFKFIVQYPGRKARWALFVQGVQGNGKSLISNVLSRAVGRIYCHPAKASQLGSKFNSVYHGKILITVEDMHVAEDKALQWESLKPMITEEYGEVEFKGVDRLSRFLPFNIILNSNYRDALPASDNERRIAPIFTAQQHKSHLARDGLTPQYFIDLFRWLDAGGWAICAEYLYTSPIPDEFNPAKLATVAPVTSSTHEAVSESRGSAEQEVLEAIAEGREGFRGGWVAGHKLNDLLATIGKAKAINRNRRVDMLRSLGYVPHPGLAGGRPAARLADGALPVLFIRVGHPHAVAGLTEAQIVACFVDAQRS